MRESTIRWSAGATVLALAAVAVGFLTLGPRSIIAPARGAFMTLLDGVLWPFLGVDGLGDPERVLNILLFVPLGAALAMLLSPRWAPLAAALTCVISVTVEFAQGSIPGRVPDPHDVLWNTWGGTIGVLGVVLVRLLMGAVHRAVRAADRP